MNTDKIAGTAKHVQGSIKEAAGKLVGDAKLQADGKADKLAGQVQGAAGDVKEAIRKAEPNHAVPPVTTVRAQTTE